MIFRCTLNSMCNDKNEYCENLQKLLIFVFIDKYKIKIVLIKKDYCIVHQFIYICNSICILHKTMYPFYLLNISVSYRKGLEKIFGYEFERNLNNLKWA